MRLCAKNILVVLNLCAAVWSVVAAVPAVRAQEPLRWQFTVGEKLDYKMVQEMKMSAAGGPAGQGGQMSTTMRQEMDMLWEVLGVNDEGEAVIKQKFDRIKMKMTTPVGGFEYDSKSDAAPTGIGAMIAPMFKAMTQGEFEITMTARGEVKDVKIPEEVLTALKSSPGAAAMGEMATADGFKKMISQGALVLPQDAPKEGETWQTKIEMNNPAVGKQTVETTYTFVGTKEIDGMKFAVIKPELKMAFGEKPSAGDKKGEEGKAKAPQISMKVGEQSSDGEVLFNIEKGRLHSTTLNQKVTIDATVAGQTLQQKIDQKIDVKVTPAAEKKPDEDAAKPATSDETGDKDEKK